MRQATGSEFTDTAHVAVPELRSALAFAIGTRLGMGVHPAALTARESFGVQTSRVIVPGGVKAMRGSVSGVFLGSPEAEMARTHAEFVVAGMHDHQADGDWPDREFIDNSMGIPHLPIKRDHPVALRELGTRPEPAFTALINPSPEVHAASISASGLYR